MERMKKTLVIGVAAAAVAGLVAVGVVSATGGDDDDSDTPITGPALARASAAALAHTGEGTVSETEVGDEEGYYEVEVTLDDGSHVDVHLDRDFNVLSTEADEADDEDSDDED